MQLERFVRAVAARFASRAIYALGDTAGATSIEYSIIAAMISVAIIGGVIYFGTQLNSQYLYLANIINPQLAH